MKRKRIITDFTKIGNNLLALRTSAGLTQADVAELTGLSERAYAAFERGKSSTRIDNFLRICKALQTTPDKILTESASDLEEKKYERENDKTQGTFFCRKRWCL